MLKLRVRIMKARGLPATNFDGTCDTCCIVTLVHGGLESSDQTSVVKGTATPEWEHKSVFKDVAGATQLRISCKSASGDPLGFVQLPSSLLQEASAGEKAKWKAEWRPLQLEAGMSTVAGELYASVTIQRTSEGNGGPSRRESNVAASSGGNGGRNKLVVEVVQARGLVAEDFNVMSADSSDPYCVLRCMGSTFETNVIDASLEPVWNESCEFIASDAQAELELTVLDKDVVGSDDFLGQLRIPVSDARVQRPKTMKDTGQRREWFELVDEQMRADGGRGEVLLALDWVRDDSVEAQREEHSQVLEAGGAATPQKEAAEGMGGILSGLIGNAQPAPAADGVFVSAETLVTSGARGNFQQRCKKRTKTGCGSKRKSAGGSKGSAPRAMAKSPLSKRGGKRDRTSQLSKEERKQRAEAARKEQERIKEANANLVRGDYDVRVHLIEARGLKGEDLSGLSDPVVQVQLLPATLPVVDGAGTQSSSIKEQVCDVVFDEMLFFTVRNIGREELQTSSICVSVFDSDRIGRHDLIGNYSFDLLGIYFRDDHEMYRQWVALIDPLNEEDRGAQGYLRLSITVLGPGDTPKVHDPMAERAKELADSRTSGRAALDINSSLCLLPPAIKQELAYLVISVYCADGLPPMDANVLGSCSIDAFVQVEFGGNPAVRTTVVSEPGDGNIVCFWEETLWVPVMLPTMSDAITLSVWDEDTFSDELVGSLDHFSFSRARAEQAQPRWANIYGPHNGTADGDAAQTMRRYPSKASAWCGRLLLDMKVLSGDEVHGAKRKEASVHVEDMKKEPKGHWPKTERYTLRAFLLSGADLPTLGLGAASTLSEIGSSLGLGTQNMYVRVCIGPYELRFDDTQVVEGQAHWGTVCEKSAIDLPKDLAQVPDVFVYLCTSAGKACCFARLKAEQLFKERMKGDVKWLSLEVDPTVTGTEGLAAHADSARGGDDASTDAYVKEHPGTLLLKIGLAHDRVAEKTSWDSDLQAQHNWVNAQVRCHIYQARGLPAADDDGTIDPYIKCRVGGKVAQTAFHADTMDPLFYETLCFNLMLREKLELAPEVVVELWDDDGKWSNDDLVATTRVPLTRATRHASAQAADKALLKASSAGRDQHGATVPRWYELGAAGSQGSQTQPSHGGQVPESSKSRFGEVLMSFQIIMLGDAREKLPPSPSIWPETRRARVDIFALGVRAMQPYLMMPISMPFVQFELQHRRDADADADAEAELGVHDESEADTGAARAAAVSQHYRTTASHTPSGPEANFLEKVSFECDLPVDTMFAPHLGVKVFDSRLGGFTTPLVGSASIPLETKLPWNKRGYIPPQSHYFKPAGPAKKGGVLGEGGGTEPRDLMAEVAKKKSAQRRRKRHGDALDHDDFEDEQKSSSKLHSRRRMSQAPLVTEPDWTKPIPGGVAQSGAAGNSRAASAEDAAPLAVSKAGGSNLWAPQEFTDGRGWWVSSEFGGGELEDFLLTTPFETYRLLLGQGSDGMVQEGNREVGVFKGIVQVTALSGSESRKGVTDAQLGMQGFSAAQPCVVRVYIMRAFNLQAKDDDGLSDPYVLLRLGDEVKNDREHYVEDSTDPDVFRCFEFYTQLPGASQLEIEVWDMDRFSPDDLIGKTVIDLEDRFFHQRWCELGRGHPKAERYGPIKPMENRSLWARGSSVVQGQVQLWLDIMSPIEAKRHKQVPIAPPEPEKFEVQLVLWKSKDVKAMDSGNMNDLFARVFLEGEEHQETDTHWRCYAGKGSWNWRFKFQVTLPMKTPEMARIHVQLWDKDVVKWNDCICSTTIDIFDSLVAAYQRKDTVKPFAESLASGAGEDGITAASDDERATLLQSRDNPIHGKKSRAERAVELVAKKANTAAGRGGDDPSESDYAPRSDDDKARDLAKRMQEMMGLGEIPSCASWITCYRQEANDQGIQTQETAGEICVSLQVVPHSQVEARPNGFGRDEPNNNPHCPLPAGRMELSINPCYMIKQLLGPELYGKFCCCFVCVICFIFLGLFGSVLSPIFVMIK